MAWFLPRYVERGKVGACPTHDHDVILTALCRMTNVFNEGYYMLASLIWLMSQCERLGRKKISPYFTDKKWSLYGVSCILTIHALASYSTTAFFLRSWENVMENWRSHNFWGHIACLIFYLLVSLLPTPAPQKRPVTKSVGTAVKLLGGMNEFVPSLQPETEQKESNVEAHKLEMKYS